MNHRRVESFYLIETVRDDGQYLCKVINDKNSYRPLIHGTSRNIHSHEIMKFDDLNTAINVCKRLENDIHANNPRVLKAEVSVNIQEVDLYGKE